MRGYSNEVQENCLKMYLNGLGFRAIERVTGVNHNTVIRWLKKSAVVLPDAPKVEEIPEITEIDELRSLRRSKKTRYGAAAVAASDASRVFELCSCDNS